MLGYFASLALLYLFLRFQLGKIRDPNHPHDRIPYNKWIQKIKDSVN